MLSGLKRVNKTSYFFNLERQRGKRNTIHQLNINGLITDEPQAISHFCYEFYTELYKSSYCADSAHLFLDSLKDIRLISDFDKDCCDQDVTLEVVDAIKFLKCIKSPGSDGIAAELYKQF